jgi:hypothetical protein
MSDKENDATAPAYEDGEHQNDELLPEQEAVNDAAAAKRGPGRPEKDWKTTAKEYAEEIKRLKKEMANERKTHLCAVTTLNSSLEIARKSSTDATAQLDGVKSDLDAVNNRYRNAQLKLEELEKLVKEKETDYNQMQIEFVASQNDCKSKEEELNEVQNVLLEKEVEIGELMAQLIKASSGDKSEASPKPQGFLIVDKLTSPIANLVSKAVDWQYDVVSDLAKTLENDNFVCTLKTMDICILFCGLSEINSGTSSVAFFKSLKRLIEILKESTKLVLVTLPPPKDSSTAIQVKLLNFQMKQYYDELPGDSLQYIDVLSSLRSKTELYTNDNLAEKCITHIAESINSKMIIPVASMKQHQKKPDASSAHCVSSTTITELIKVPNQAVGSIIGKRGHNIKDLTSTFNVSISVGKWYEKQRNDDFSERFDAVIISGKIDNVRQSAERVNDICRESLKFEPETKKPKTNFN